LYLPSLSLSGDYTKFNGTQAYPEVIERESMSYTYGFSVRWNIFDGFARERELSRAKIMKNNSASTLADTRNKVTAEIKTAYLDIERQREANEVARENVEAATEDMKIVQERYNLGAATILDILNAQEALKRAHVDQINSNFDLNLAVARLENAMGKM